MALVQVLKVVTGAFTDAVLEAALCVDVLGDLGNGLGEFFLEIAE